MPRTMARTMTAPADPGLHGWLVIDKPEGAVTAESSIRPDSAAIAAVLPRFTGALLQRPPAFSAIKIAGRRAYALARAGHPPEMLERSIEIAALRMTRVLDPDHAEF